MSILNFALQRVVLVRDNLSKEMKTLFSKANTTFTIKKRIEKLH